MITMEELLNGRVLSDQPNQTQNNLRLLLEKLNEVRKLYGKPMGVTSGLRTPLDHLRIYQEKAAREKKPFDIKRVPTASKHLIGAAADIYDPKRTLTAWCLTHQDDLERLGLYCEDFNYTRSWVHFQITAPKSGKRFFKP